MVRQFNVIKNGGVQVIDNNSVTFVVALKGREYNIAGFVANVRGFYPDCKIVFSVLEGGEVWNKGALYNLGYRHTNTEIVVFADVDCRLRDRVDFGTVLKQYGKPFVPFDMVSNYKDCMLINTNYRLTAWGGFAVFTRKMFEECGGYSNRIEGWGWEDELIKRRSGMIRLQGVINHIYHERLCYESKNSGQLEKNRNVLENDDKELDNINTVTAENTLIYKENGIIWAVYRNIKNQMFTVVQKNENRKKDIIFNQYFGIGDIIFIEPIMRSFFQRGHKVVLPVLKKYMDIQPYFPYITIVDKDDLNIDYDCKKVVVAEEHVVYPVRWSMEYFNDVLVNTMRNKYKMFDIDLEVWRSTTWLRHRWKENKLIKHLGLNTKEEYILVNNNFYSFDNKVRKFELDSKLNVIQMEFIDGYNLFDWCTIIENATEIHTVNTSIIFLIEILELKAREIHLYSRNAKGKDFKQTEYLRSKNYILHD